ncbi:F-box [Cotonvirus japonicus]|uniref:F-box n=1 Tax=Cotonvirus japonicus TaxID=2811091 RepID=A0ABM7NQZ9_9VIRU|nr:F-box [Cotonvirus japonicus]BCS82582.1 F-box [Cotonvirus japonicus]
MLPEEILYYIFNSFTIKQLIKCSQVCSQFRRICLDETIWQKKAEIIGTESVIIQYAKWRKQLKKYTGKRIVIERLAKTGEEIITTFSKNHVFDTLVNKTIVPGILIDCYGSNTKFIIDSSKKIYSSFHRKNEIRLEYYPLARLNEIKHDLRRFYIIVIPASINDDVHKINLAQYYLNVQKIYYWINIFAIICSPSDNNILRNNLYTEFHNTKIKIFNDQQYNDVFEWISKMVWMDDFRFGTTFCQKNIPTRNKLLKLTTDKSILNNMCFCQ